MGEGGLGSGWTGLELTVTGGKRPAKLGDQFPTLGVPLDVQAVFTPVRSLVTGLHGSANVNPGDNLLGVSLQLQVCLSR